MIGNILKVFIAGPFRGANDWERACNVHRAAEIALDVWRLGHVAYCPHLNTAQFHDTAPDDVWLRGHQEMLKVCDAVVLVGNWKSSAGTLSEIALANKLGIPVLEDIFAFARWIHPKDDSE